METLPHTLEEEEKKKKKDKDGVGKKIKILLHCKKKKKKCNWWQLLSAVPGNHVWNNGFLTCKSWKLVALLLMQIV